ncbi:hypothetical protein [Couchioplanes caeruleus]|uniref:hypothetical protein n=1 Tax=Couchioplanes caeruleus TaxID=56438 RepID=UPI001160C569|nr:hypothetical protein [Couchioplanes caeruleus]
MTEIAGLSILALVVLWRIIVTVKAASRRIDDIVAELDRPRDEPTDTLIATTSPPPPAEELLRSR